MSDRSTHVTLINATNVKLVQTELPDLVHGKMDDANGSGTPNTINPHSSASWLMVDKGIMTGVEGIAHYALSPTQPGKDGRLEFSWKNPYIGSNSYDVIRTPDGFKVTQSGGSGNSASVTFELSPI